jgi:protocatechuate 3,4-dioxygenase beta subunit
MRRGPGILIAAGVLAAGLWFALAGRPVDPAVSSPPSEVRATVPARVVPREGASTEASVTGAASGQAGNAGASARELEGNANGCWLRGRVTDETGQPLPDAEVVVRHSEGGFRLHAPSKNAQTDEEGRYALGPFGPGLYNVAVDAKGYTATRVREHPLAAPEETLDVSLPRAVPVEGTVVDEDGKPVAGASLFMFGPADDPEDEDGEPRFTYASADSDGAFLLDAPQPGGYRIKLEHTDFLVAEETVTAPLQGARLVMSSGASVRVEVVDETGAPVPDVEVQVQPEVLTPSSRERLDDTDETGTVTLRGLSPGPHTVVATLTETVPERTAKHALELRGSERARVRLQLPSGLRLSGVVVDLEGKPVAGAEVRAVPAGVLSARRGQDPELELHAQDLQADWAEGPTTPQLTGPDGRFTLRYLRPGEHLVTALRQGSVFDGEATGGKVRMLEPHRGVLVSAGAKDVRLVMRARAYVRGRVVRADGSPVRHFQVNETILDDPQGAFRWPISGDGEEVLAFAAPELAGTLRKVRVRQGVDADLGDVVLHAGREVRVRVVDAKTSAPLSEAAVELREPGAEDVDRPLLWNVVRVRAGHHATQTFLAHDALRTGEGGTLVLPNVEERPWLLRVSHADYLPVSVGLDAAQGEVTVRLRAGAWMEGEVRAGTEPIFRGLVLLRTPRGEHVELTSIIDGTYSLGPVEAGSYLAQVEPEPEEGEPPAVFPATRVELPASGRVTLDLVAPPGGTSVEVHAPEAMEAVLLVPGAHPLSCASGSLDGLFNLGIRGRGRQEGPFRLGRLPAGHYTLFALRDGSVSPVEVHHEEVDVPAREAETFTVRPRWQPCSAAGALAE